jgi:hypothetical protein
MDRLERIVVVERIAHVRMSVHLSRLFSISRANMSHRNYSW